MGTMTCFEKEAERNLEMVYYTVHLATRKVLCDHIVSNAVATKRRDNQSVAFSPFNMMEFLLSLFSFFSRFSTLVWGLSRLFLPAGETIWSRIY